MLQTTLGNLPDEFLTDELSNRVSSLLMSLGGVCVWSGSVAPAALYALVHATHQHHVNAKLVATICSR